MSLHRRAARRDANEREIIDALEAAGCSVQQLSGDPGLPDLIVAYPDRVIGIWINTFMEVKMLKGKLTPDQIEWHRKWPVKVHIVRNVEDALKAIGRI